MIRSFRLLPLLVLLPAVVAAHPDHPHTLGFADSFSHLFSSPYHLLMLLLPLVVARVAVILFGKKALHWLRDRQR